ncbi:MAG TPA: hypothetical protein VGA50_08765, partial [Kiloniellales bacterium]
MLHEADRCTKVGDLGALLRREGLYSSNLTAWRAAQARGELAGDAGKRWGPKPKPPHPEAKRRKGQTLKRRATVSSTHEDMIRLSRLTRNEPVRKLGSVRAPQNLGAQISLRNHDLASGTHRKTRSLSTSGCFRTASNWSRRARERPSALASGGAGAAEKEQLRFCGGQWSPAAQFQVVSATISLLLLR